MPGRSDDLPGRGEELTRMRALLAPDRGPVFVVVTGEPGIGKSRLCAAFEAAATGAGVPVLTGRATELECGAPWALFRHVLDDVVDLDWSGGYAESARRLRALSATLSRQDPDSLSVMGVERHRVHRAGRALLEAAATPSGLLLVFDDLHWADTASVEFIDYLVRHPTRRVVTVLVARTGRLPTLLERSLDSAATLVERMPLGSLSLDDAGLLLPDASPAYRRKLYEIGGGNPLHLEILGRLPVHEVEELRGVSAAVGGDLTGLAPLISRELRDLPEPLFTVVRAAAVTADTFDTATVASVAELPQEAVGVALDALVDRDVLRAPEGRIEFRHPLVRAAAYRLAGPLWRSAAHQRAAEHLAREGAPPSVRAEHLRHGLRRGDTVGATLLAEAATRSADMAPADAARWLRAALDATQDGADPDGQRAAWRLTMAKTLAVSGQFDEARTVLHELAASGDTACRHQALELLAASERALGRFAEVRARLGAELAAPDTTPDGLRTALHVELAATDMLGGQWDSGARQAAEALRLAGPGDRSGIAVVARTLLAVAELYRCRFSSGYRLLDQARWHVDGLTDLELRDDIGLLPPLAWAEFLVDDHEDALRHVERGMDIARRYGRSHVVPQMYVVRSVVHARMGLVPLALVDAEDGEEIARHLESAEMHSFVLAVKALPLLWHSGPEEAVTLAARIRDRHPLRSVWWRNIADQSLADMYFQAGRPAECRALLAARPDSGPVGLGPHAPSLYAVRAEAEVACGDRAAGREWYERAAEAAASGAPRAQYGSVVRARATLLLAENRLEDARDEAYVAVEHFRAAALPVDEGFARLLTARILTALGDAHRADEELGRARRLFTGCDAPWLVRAVGREQRRAGAQRPRTRPAGLTARERQIAELVARGLTSPQIAEQLFLSVRTVESHLARVFHKAGVTGRVALARKIAEEGLPG
ncbi:ATP-binding protein [Streptomyces fuscichromogenes]|uniref:ATP-binding protein n=1 Tax=Streptomyces fuscichromogenes TaxID=1324013 RepID=UPI003814B5F7